MYLLALNATERLSDKLLFAPAMRALELHLRLGHAVLRARFRAEGRDDLADLWFRLDH